MVFIIRNLTIISIVLYPQATITPNPDKKH
jgi:hypothetical protein